VTDDLIATARLLAGAGSRRPRQVDLKRAISTAYYALYHAMAGDAADLLVGKRSSRSTGAWVQVHRALEHGFAKDACKKARSQGFTLGICSCADAFVKLQEARHEADYNPIHRVYRADAVAAITLAEQAIKDLRSSTRSDRTAFAVHVLLKKRP
jgi:hypothetical protein